MKLRVPKQSDEMPEMCDLTQNGSDAISHLPFHFVNEEKLQIPKKIANSVSARASIDVGAAAVFGTPSSPCPNARRQSSS